MLDFVSWISEKAIMNDCQMLTTEISQVPLSGVLASLRTAK